MLAMWNSNMPRLPHGTDALHPLSVYKMPHPEPPPLLELGSSWLLIYDPLTHALNHSRLPHAA